MNDTAPQTAMLARHASDSVDISDSSLSSDHFPRLCRKASDASSDSASALSSEHFPGSVHDLDSLQVPDSLLDADVNALSCPRSGDALQRHLMSAVWDKFAADPQHKLSCDGTARPYMRVYAVGRRAVLHSTSSFHGDLKVGCVQKVPGLARPISMRALHNHSTGTYISIPAEASKDPSLRLQHCAVEQQITEGLADAAIVPDAEDESEHALRKERGRGISLASCRRSPQVRFEQPKARTALPRKVVKVPSDCDQALVERRLQQEAPRVGRGTRTKIQSDLFYDQRDQQNHIIAIRKGQGESTGMSFPKMELH